MSSGVSRGGWWGEQAGRQDYGTGRRAITLSAPPGAPPVKILAVETLLPPNRFESPEVERAFEAWLSGRPAAERARARRIVRGAGVRARHSFLTLDEIFTPCSLTESSRRFREHAVALGSRLLDRTLRSARIAPRDVDILITTSCTGFMIPSVDAYLAEALGMRPDVMRLPVTEMGCAAGASSLMYAGEMLRGRGGGVAAVVNIEFPTNTIQLERFDTENIVGTAIFSDGLGCTLLGSSPGPGLAEVDAWTMRQVPATIGLLGYQLTETGFVMNLDASLPDVVQDQFDRLVSAFLGANGLSMRDIDHFLVHPGGVKILDRIEAVLEPYGRNARLSREVMSDLGNMSSSTVIFILQRLLASSPAPGRALLMSFGPGLGAHLLLLTVPEHSGESIRSGAKRRPRPTRGTRRGG